MMDLVQLSGGTCLHALSVPLRSSARGFREQPRLFLRGVTIVNKHVILLPVIAAILLTVVLLPSSRQMRIALAQGNADRSLLEDLNDGPSNAILAPLVVYNADGSVAKGKLTFQPKQTWRWRLVLTPSELNNFHVLNSVGGSVFINASAIVSDGCQHQTTTSGWLSVSLPPYGTTGGDPRSAVNDLQLRNTTWLVADNAPNNPIWIDARDPICPEFLRK
jgi:hypothetical protein